MASLLAAFARRSTVELLVAATSLLVSGLTALSVAERQPSVLSWRLARSLRSQPYTSTPDSDFSDLTSLIAAGERPFSREPLEEHVVSRLRSAIKARQICVILGGTGGIGKSVLLESLLGKRGLERGADGVWKDLAGPTRVIDLLECASLDDFRRKVTAAFHPQPFLPSFGLSPPPSYNAALAILKRALRMLPPDTPLIVFVEDINSLLRMPELEWQPAFVSFATLVASRGNGIVVGNSSALLAYTNFESLPHAGLRTARFFLPSLPRESEELVKYASDGGHLYKAGFKPRGETPCPDFTYRIALWDGNVQMIKEGSDSDVARVASRIHAALQDISLVGKPQWAHLVTPACTKDPATILEQRAILLQLLCDSPNNEVPLLSLSVHVCANQIAEQLAAVDLVTFRTVKDAAGVDFEVVAPYHPVVIDLYRARKAAIDAAVTT